MSIIIDKERKIILREENEFPMLFANHAEREYGILFYNTDNTESNDSNHAILYPEKITDLDAVLEDIIQFYAKLGYAEVRIYHPFVPNYFANNQKAFEAHGFTVHIEENHPVLVLCDENTLKKSSSLRIERVTEWNERIYRDILKPDEGEHEVGVIKNALKHAGFYLFVGYVGDKAIVELNFHVSESGCTRFDHIVTAPDERGKGYAREIVSYAVDFCRANDFPLCYQWPDNGTSERITTAAGFRYAFDIEAGWATCELEVKES
jgi:GNAT superfamily N-acetyltransferase